MWHVWHAIRATCRFVSSSACGFSPWQSAQATRTPSLAQLFGSISRRDPVVLRAVAVDADHPLPGVGVGLPREGEPALDQHAAAGRLVAHHAVLHARLPDRHRRLHAPVLPHDDPALLVLERLPLPEIVRGGVTHQAIDRVLRLLPGAPHVADVVPRVAGIAPRELRLPRLRVRRDLLQVVHDVVAVAHRVDPVLHPVLFPRIHVVHVGHRRGVFPVDGRKELLRRAGVTPLRFARRRPLVAVLLDVRLAGVLLRLCGGTGDQQQEQHDRITLHAPLPFAAGARDSPGPPDFSIPPSCGNTCWCSCRP